MKPKNVLCVAELWRERDSEHPRADQHNCPTAGKFYRVINTIMGYYVLEGMEPHRWHPSGFAEIVEQPVELETLYAEFPKAPAYV